MRQLLTFSVGSERFGLELGHVQEVVEEPAVYFVPCPPAGLCGALTLHGAVLAVLDLAVLLDVSAPEPEARLVVIDPQIAAVALQVSRVEGICDIAGELLAAPRGAVDIAWLKERYDHPDGIINLLDPQELLNLLGTRRGGGE